MMKQFFTTLICLFLSVAVYSQTLTPTDSVVIQQQEQLLKKLADKMLTSKVYEERRDANYSFIKEFKKALKTPNSFYYDFSSLDFLKIVYSPDQRFRLITWQIELPAKLKRHYGAIQMNETDLKLFPLIDRSEDMKTPQKFVGDNTKWYGALYYEVVMKEIKGNKKYFLIGYDANHPLSNKKIVEVLQFNSENKPVLGAPLFQSWKRPTETVTRFLIEYKGDAVVTLHYDKNRKAIIYDHLVPLTKADIGIYIKYVPDGTFDALLWKNNKFFVKQNVVATTPDDGVNEGSATRKSDIIYQPN